MSTARLDVRRLAALDMHGAHGTLRRRLIILLEFVFGTIGSVALACWALTWGGSLGFVVAVWLFGLGANYVPLGWHVIRLWPPGELQAELADADVHAEMQHYTRAQVWVLLPFWIAGLAVVQGLRAR